MQYKHRADGTVRDWVRRRAWGGGRHRSCQALRVQLAEWFSIMRHSVDVKLMCRFPKQCLMMKAIQLQQDYHVACAKKGQLAETVVVSPNWLRGWMAEYRVSSRRPNRKFKVPKTVLAERLAIFWTVVTVLRKLVWLHFGYDPRMRNVDQSPFHMNEAGSAATNTLVIKNAPTVPLVENHAATRERWSLNSVTDSCRERIMHQLPGCELMFKAEGKTVERKLQAHVESMCLPFKFSVVTGPSGSYREHDILNYSGSAFSRSGPPLGLSPPRPSSAA